VPIELPPTAQHGTCVGYGHYGCGCDPCREASRVYIQGMRTRLRAERVMRRNRWYHPRAPHGSHSGYVTYGCRCPPCTAAHSG